MKVSAYIPAYNAEKTIEPCIKSLLNQSIKFDDIIVIDDASADNTKAIAESLNVRVISNKRNSGLSYSRNIGIAHCRSELIAGIDSDVSLQRDWLDNLVKEFKNRSIVGVGGKLIETDKSLAGYWKKEHLRQDWGENEIIDPNYLSGSNTIFKKKILKRLKFNKKYRKAFDDVDFCQRVMKLGNIKYCPKAKAFHLSNDSLLSLLRKKWNYGFYNRAEPKQILNILKNFLTNIKTSISFSSLDWKQPKLLIIDFLLPLGRLYLDLEYYLKRGYF